MDPARGGTLASTLETRITPQDSDHLFAGPLDSDYGIHTGVSKLAAGETHFRPLQPESPLPPRLRRNRLGPCAKVRSFPYRKSRRGPTDRSRGLRFDLPGSRRPRSGPDRAQPGAVIPAPPPRPPCTIIRMFLGSRSCLLAQVADVPRGRSSLLYGTLRP